MKDRYLFKGKRLDNGQRAKGNLLKDGLTGQVFIHADGNSVNESDEVDKERGFLQFYAFEHSVKDREYWKERNKEWQNTM